MYLSDLQQQLTQTILGNKPSYSLESAIKRYSRDELEARLDIYRNNYYASFEEVLRETYSSVNQIVGEEFFNALSAAYIRQHPPQHAAMIYLGENFSDFIKHFEHTQSLPYLADLALLDWHRQLAYHAAEAEPLAPEFFQKTDNSTLSNSLLQLHPSTNLLKSEFAIFTIWDSLTNTNLNDSTPILYDTPETLLTVRPDTEVRTWRLPPPVTELINQLAAKKTLIQSIEAALETGEKQQITFNPSEAIAFLVSSRVIISLEDHKVEEK